MEIAREDHGEVVILRLAGRLIGEETAGNVTHQAVRSEVDAGKRKILVDLSKVPFVNSTGLGVLVVCYVRLRKEGGDLKLVSPTGRVRTLLNTVPRLFEVYGDEAEALASFD